MRRTSVRRVEENDVNEKIPPQVEQVEQVPQGAQYDQDPFQDDQVPIMIGGNDILVVSPQISDI